MTLKIIYTMCFLEILGVGLLLPLLGPHMLSLGCSHTLIGLLGSLSALLQLVLNPIGGSLSDVKGRKPLLIQVFAIGTLSNVLLAMFSKSVLGIFISRLIGAVQSQAMILLKTLTADTVPQDQQTAVYGKMGAMFGAGFILGPLIGGSLLEFDNGFSYIALLAAFLTFSTCALALLLPNIKPKQSPETTKEKVPSTVPARIKTELSKTVLNFKKVNWNVFYAIFMVKFLTECSFQMFHSTFALLPENFNLSRKAMGYTLSFFGFLMVLCNILMAKIKERVYSDDKDGSKRVYHGLYFLTGSLILLSSAPTFAFYLLFLIPMSIVRPLMDATWTELLISKTNETEKGVVMGTFESLMSLAGLITPLLSGVIADLWGGNAPGVFAAVPVLISIYFAQDISKRHHEHVQ